jgi:hypothetical protein
MASEWQWRQVDLPLGDPANTSNVFALNGWKHHLYLGTRNLVNGGEIFRSRDGVAWEVAGEPGFGNEFNRDIYGFVGFQDHLYAGTYNGIHKGKETEPVTGAQVWRSLDGESWECVVQDGYGDPNNQDTFNLVTFWGHLYVGTFNPVSGAEIHRSKDGRRWERVYKTGSASQDYIRAFGIMDGKLYAAIGKLGPVALLETTNGTDWTDVSAGRVPDHLTDIFRIAVVEETLVAAMTKWGDAPLEMWRYRGGTWDPIGEPGFGNANNVLAGGLAVHRDRIAAATWNEIEGTQVWLCDDLNNPDWRQINENGFGDPRNVGCVFGMTVFGDNLYVGTTTIHDGFASQLWVGDDS